VSLSRAGSTREPTSMPNHRPALVMAALCRNFWKPEGGSRGSTGGIPPDTAVEDTAGVATNDDVRELALYGAI
jgi:hypothetical protein